MEDPDPEDLTFGRLELCTYRYLQKLAKSMNLPSNVKKTYLIEMIHATKYYSAEQANAIVDRVKDERKQSAKPRKPMKRKKKWLQGTEVSSTSNHSPPITMTPQHSDYIITYPPSPHQEIMTYQRSNIMQPTIAKRAYKSDRVLRSFNNRRRPNYSILNVNSSVIGVIKAQNALHRAQDLQEKQYELSVALRSHRPVNIGECVMERHRPVGYEDHAVKMQPQIDFGIINDGEKQLVPVVCSINASSPIPAKRQRKVSYIYPLKPQESHCHYTPSVGFRQRDGRLSKINAVVQKPMEKNNLPITAERNEIIKKAVSRITAPLTILRRNIVPKSQTSTPKRTSFTVQDLLNDKIDQYTFSNSSTESARDSSIERENIPIENLNGNLEGRSYLTEKAEAEKDSRNRITEISNQYTERIKCAPENPYRYTENINTTKGRNHITENLTQYTESTKCTTENLYQHKEFRNTTENNNYSTENLNSYTETRNDTIKYPKQFNRTNTCITESANKYTESDDCLMTIPITGYLETPKRYEGVKNCSSKNPSSYTEIRNDAIEYTKQYNKNRNNFITETTNKYTESDDCPMTTAISRNADTPSRYAGVKNCATRKPSPCTEIRNDSTEYPKQYNKNRNNTLVTETTNKYTESDDCPMTTQISRNPETPKRYYEGVRNCATENPNIYTDHRSYATETQNLTDRNNTTQYPNQYTARNYITENQFQDTRIRNTTSTTETPNKYTESKCHIETLKEYTETPNSYTGIRTYATETLCQKELGNYTAENENRMFASEHTNGGTNYEAVNVQRDYPNMSALTDTYPENQVAVLNSNSNGNFSVYYHKKIRAEQVRSQRRYSQPQMDRTNNQLPRITEVFSRFKNAQYKNMTQPLYLQISDHTEKLPYNVNDNSTLLETIYNFKNHLIPKHLPLCPIATAGRTRLVYSAPAVITTPAAPPPPTAFNDRTTHSHERGDPQRNVVPERTLRLCDYLGDGEHERRGFACDEELSPGSSFGTTSSQLGANVTIPEMVDDAMELISQDGDYMERIEMDGRMQCTLCEWAGSKIFLEYHIRTEHGSSVIQQDAPEWSAVFSLGALVSSACSRLFHHRGHIFALSARCVGDWFMASIMVLPTVSDDIPRRSRLTVYNKVTGEPYTWEGDVTQSQDTMQSSGNWLKLEIIKLDLLPNSANLQLRNGELVVSSAAKVVVGQPELNNIEVVVYVQLFD